MSPNIKYFGSKKIVTSLIYEKWLILEKITFLSISFSNFVYDRYIIGSQNLGPLQLVSEKSRSKGFRAHPE